MKQTSHHFQEIYILNRSMSNDENEKTIYTFFIDDFVIQFTVYKCVIFAENAITIFFVCFIFF